jgi:hypothetical protein
MWSLALELGFSEVGEFFEFVLVQRWHGAVAAAPKVELALLRCWRGENPNLFGMVDVLTVC